MNNKSELNTILCKEGFLIQKKDTDNKTLIDIKNELTVEPVQACKFLTKKPLKFKVYQENEDYLCIPKYYGLTKFGDPKINKELKGDKVDLKFNSQLRPKQIEIIDKIIPHLDNYDGGVLCLPCGYGKCLAYDTEILMYDGTIKKVQDINVNDLIMGDDSTHRTVLSLGRGKEDMYNIIDNYGYKYTVNKSHILSLYDHVNNMVINMTVNEYLKNPNAMKLKGYRVPINFQTNKLSIEPYIFGSNLLDNYNHIPYNYKINSIRNRLLLFFGIFDRYGFMNYYNNTYELECVHDILSNDIIFLARSVGFTAYKKNNIIAVIFTNLYDNYYNAYDIRVEYAGINNYYGFEIDYNRLFVLGDFTVTHNTILSLYIASHYSLKTLVIVHKTFLLNQWKERAEEFTNATVGIIQQNKVDIEGKQIVIGMLQSIAKDKYDTSIFKDFGLVIFDEAHHAPSKYFSQALPIISCKKTLGLSATPKRSDKLEKILYWYFGNIMYKLDNVTNDKVLVNIYNYKLEHEKFREFKLRNGEINRAKTINKLTTIGRRNKFIINIIREVIEPKRKIIVLSDRVEHLKLLKERLEKYNTEDNIIITSFYIGGMKIEKLKKSEEAQVIFATYSMAAEALDIPELNTLFMVTPRREIEQAVGRILRKIDPLTRPIIYDFIDQLPSFINQGRHRKQFYKKLDFEQNIINVDDNKIVNQEDSEEKNNNDCDKKSQYDFID
jgi:superfamily II DNA or RNA helicase